MSPGDMIPLRGGCVAFKSVDAYVKYKTTGSFSGSLFIKANSLILVLGKVQVGDCTLLSVLASYSKAYYSKVFYSDTYKPAISYVIMNDIKTS